MGFAAARVTVALDAAVTDTTHIQVHDGDPGAGGTANTVGAREPFVFPAAVDGETAQTVQVTIGPGGPYTHVTGWDALTDGTLQWDAPLVPAETFAGEGLLEITVTATAENKA